MLWQNEFSAPPIPTYKGLRKSDEADSSFLYALTVLYDARVLDKETIEQFASTLYHGMTLSQQLAAWRARRKVNG